MTLHQKNINRLRFKWIAVCLIVLSVVGGFVLAWHEKKIDGFGTIVGSASVFATGIFGVDYFSKPSEEQQ